MLVGYARVSTIDQNPRLQIDALKEAGCEKIFWEKVSGASPIRKQLNEAIDYMRPGDTLVIWKLSRLARSLSQVIKIVNDLENRRLNIKILKQDIDTTTPSGKLMFYVNAAYDEFQRDMIKENTEAGLLAARKRGKFPGRPRKLMDDQIKLAVAMLKDPINFKSIRDIVKVLKISRSSFYNYFNAEKIQEIRDINNKNYRV